MHCEVYSYEKKIDRTSSADEVQTGPAAAEPASVDEMQSGPAAAEPASCADLLQSGLLPVQLSYRVDCFLCSSGAEWVAACADKVQSGLLLVQFRCTVGCYLCSLGAEWIASCAVQVQIGLLLVQFRCRLGFITSGGRALRRGLRWVCTNSRTVNITTTAGDGVVKERKNWPVPVWRREDRQISASWEEREKTGQCQFGEERKDWSVPVGRREERRVSRSC